MAFRFVLLISSIITSVFSQPCPPGPVALRGWNSWDPIANTVNENDILNAATWMRDNLLQYGFNIITIDGGWYSNQTSGNKQGSNIIDGYGLPVPDVTRFPSSAGGKGLLPLAQQINKMGLKLGAWTIRGITPEAYTANLPIKNSNFRARDVGLLTLATNCSWDPNTLGTNAPSLAADAWYASLADHYTANGLQFVKIDCMFGGPSHDWWFEDEVNSFATAFAARAPNIDISWSPGNAQSPAGGAYIAAHAPAWGNMYRITNDFHDNEGTDTLLQHLDVAAFFAPLIGVNGSFPDLDMLPFGLQSGGENAAGQRLPPRQNLFTEDEQRLVMTLWAMTRAPLMLGTVLPLPANDTLTLSLVGNAAVLDINARSCRNAPTPVLQTTNTTALYAWTASAPEGDAIIVALFNMRDQATNVSAATGVPGGCVTNVWTSASDGTLDSSGLITKLIAPRASGLYSVGTC